MADYSNLAGKGTPGISQFQQNDFSSIANILNETLSKLKRPNKHFLTPLDQSVLKASKVDAEITNLPLKKKTIPTTKDSKSNISVNLRNLVGFNHA